jgi:hypothetical protein
VGSGLGVCWRTLLRESVVEPSPFTAWESFYVIIGSSAAALTGLQFVVIALSADSRLPRGPETVGAFGTPTVVHFCAVLLVSAILSAPWGKLSSAGLALGVCGAAGIVYTLIVLRRARAQQGYKPVLEDWLWHATFPLIAYAALLGAALGLGRDPTHCLFAIGTTALLLLFIGIHNAWDAAAYVATQPKEPPENLTP